METKDVHKARAVVLATIALVILGVVGRMDMEDEIRRSEVVCKTPGPHNARMCEQWTNQ